MKEKFINVPLEDKVPEFGKGGQADVLRADRTGHSMLHTLYGNSLSMIIFHFL